MAFLEHETLTERICTAWHLIDEGYGLEIKMLGRKIKPMELDSKADPEVLNKLKNARNEVARKKSRSVVECVKYKLMISVPLEKFKNDPNFDGCAAYDADQARKRELLKSAK
jgi:hypothetical protein